MPRPSRRDDLDDRRPQGKAQPPSFAGTLLAAVGFGVTLIIGGVIGFTAGRSPREVEKPRSLELAENTPPPVTPPPKPVTKQPVPKPTPKPPVIKPKPKPPEPEPKKPELKKPDPEPKKPDPKPPQPTPKMSLVSFDKDVLPIFKAKCNVCHGDAGNPKGDLDLRTLARALRGGDNGPGAKPGNLDDSQIWVTVENGSMPPAGKEKLTDAEKKTIKDWILSGAK